MIQSPVKSFEKQAYHSIHLEYCITIFVISCHALSYLDAEYSLESVKHYICCWSLSKGLLIAAIFCFRKHPQVSFRMFCWSLYFCICLVLTPHQRIQSQTKAVIEARPWMKQIGKRNGEGGGGAQSQSFKRKFCFKNKANCRCLERFKMAEFQR